MKDDLIDHYFDEKGIKREADAVLAEFARVQKALIELDKVEVSFGKVTTSKELRTITNELIAAQKKLEESGIKLAAVANLGTKAEDQHTEAKRRGKKATEENLSSVEKEAKAQLDTMKAKREGVKYVAALEKEIEKLNKERVKEEERLGKLGNAYEQLKAKYAVAANSAKALAAAKGLDDAQTKEAIATSQRYYQQLVNIEKAVGQSQRQVGDYRQATFALTQVLREAPAFANSFATGISAISNNMPVLTDEFKKLRESTGSSFQAFKILAGGLLSFNALLPIGFLLIQTYGKEIAGFISNLFSAKKAIDETKAAQELLNKAYGDSGLKDAIKTVEELTLNVDLAKKGFISKKEVVNQYNETMGKTTGQLTDFAAVEKRIVEAGPAYIKMMLYRAAANAALEDAAKKALQAEQDRAKKTQEFQSVATNASVGTVGQVMAPGFVPSLSDVDAGIKARADAAQKRKTAVVKESEDEQNVLEKIANDFSTKAGEISKKFKFNFLGGEYDDKETKASTEDFKKGLADQQREMQKALAEITRSRIEAERNSGLAVGEDEANAFDKRLEGYRTFYNKSLELLRFNTTAERQAITDKATEESRLVQEKLKEKSLTAEQRTDLQQTLIAIDKTAGVQRLAVEAEYNRDVIKLNEASEKQITGLMKEDLSQRAKDRAEAIKKQKDALIEELDIQQSFLNTLKNGELSDLSKQLSDRLITVEQYNAKRKEIEDRFAKESIDNETQVLEQQLQLYGYTEKERAKIIERLSELQLKATETRADREKDQLKQIEKAEEDLADKRKKLALDLYDVLVSVNAARFDREKERNNEEIKTIDERKERETSTIKQTVTNAVERDKQIAIVEARATVQKEQLSKRSEDIERRKAGFEKAAAITRIAIETTLAVLKLKAQAAVYAGGVLTAPLAAIPLAQIPVVIISGAIAAAAIAAKKFFRGKPASDNYEGPAIVGDGGRSELIIRKDGRMEVTPDVPTLTHVDRDDIVLPDAKKEMANADAPFESIRPNPLQRRFDARKAAMESAEETVQWKAGRLLENLDEEFAKGAMPKEQHEVAKEEIENNYLKASLGNQIRYGISLAGLNDVGYGVRDRLDGLEKRRLEICLPTNGKESLNEYETNHQLTALGKEIRSTIQALEAVAAARILNATAQPPAPGVAEGPVRLGSDGTRFAKIMPLAVALPSVDRTLRSGGEEARRTIHFINLPKEKPVDEIVIVDGINSGIRRMERSVVKAIKDKPVATYRQSDPMRDWVFGNTGGNNTGI